MTWGIVDDNHTDCMSSPQSTLKSHMWPYTQKVCSPPVRVNSQKQSRLVRTLNTS